MTKLSIERKEAILSQLLPPNNFSVSDVAKKESIGESTLYNWLSKIKSEGGVVPGNKKSSEQWSAEMKFMTVVATAAMSAEELSQYCRKNGLYIAQIEQWKAACIAGAMSDNQRQKRERAESKKDKKQIKILEKELLRKDKALAETAALLVLRKKLNAYWGVGENEDD